MYVFRKSLPINRTKDKVIEDCARKPTAKLNREQAQILQMGKMKAERQVAGHIISCGQNAMACGAMGVILASGVQETQIAQANVSMKSVRKHNDSPSMFDFPGGSWLCTSISLIFQPLHGTCLNTNSLFDGVPVGADFASTFCSSFGLFSLLAVSPMGGLQQTYFGHGETCFHFCRWG